MEISPVSSSSEPGFDNKYENQINQLETEKNQNIKKISDEQLSGDEKRIKEEKIQELEKQMKLIELQIQQMKAHEMLQKVQNVHTVVNNSNESVNETKAPLEEKYIFKDTDNELDIKI